MKHILEILLRQALFSLQTSGEIAADINPAIFIDYAKDKNHGDYASNLALILAKPCQKPPRKLAERLITHLPSSDIIEKIDIAGAGFINFFIKPQAWTTIVSQILLEKSQFGHCKLGNNEKIILEFVSANPTGPLHVGHGRGAAFGSSLANILQAAGYKVDSEYYVNDAGRQMNILAVSIWLRYLQIAGENIIFPANAYKGDYVADIAQNIFKENSTVFVKKWTEVSQNLPADESEGGDKEQYIDALIDKAKQLLGQEGFATLHSFGTRLVLEDIKDDLKGFKVHFDRWFSEQSLMSDGSITKGIAALKNAGYTYEQENALWFRATAFGDEKDRVLIRANGQHTYFAADVAYHWNKYERGYARVINIFGADHHGYISRIKATVKALGHDEKTLDILLVQFAILYRGKERIQMSTRSGSFVTLRELRDEVGNDAARYFYVMRKPEQHMDFDLNLAKSESNDNPVYYIQYAHARICSVLKQLKERGLQWDEKQGLAYITNLDKPQETALLVLLTRYSETIEAAAISCEPHLLAYYLRELANGLHSYYNAVTLLCENEALRAARLCLLTATRQVLHNGLNLLGVSCPESM